MNILAIETSCDESGVALLTVSPVAHGGAPKAVVREDLVASQIKLHREFGGVVPNLAKREHIKNLPILFARLQRKLRAKKIPFKFDMIAVTVGPGLEPALWTGITFAQALAKEYKKPLVGANHLEGHLYSFLLPPRQQKTVNSKLQIAKSKIRTKAQATKIAFPAIGLIVSGGHTILIKMDSLVKWKHLGETRDDAAGEAFDKAARMLDLPYPGGPEIERLAKTGDPHTVEFPRPMLHEKNYEFSFSGLKTSVLYYLRDHPDALTGKKGKADIAASFQAAALDVLVAKTMRAAREYGAKSVILCGGVASNNALRGRLRKATHGEGRAFFVPERRYNLDNGAMIGLAGYMAHLRGKRYPFKANGNLGI
ncbi:MAG: tRNA (adenosine(37)-N6)-threonylcarbamoyltransferase complex transferase subunit TsaD [Candidatus Pacebacteria bacterium]|nr:tRNA (adenosine(37)-N6)-threonylcarbamoyltransferase complex transferase subunit TsaD [Candidatus Paceibacterota bacterium]